MKSDPLAKGEMSSGILESGSERAVCVSDSAQRLSSAPGVRWPPKHDVIGVQVSRTTYDEAVECILRAVEQRTTTLREQR